MLQHVQTYFQSENDAESAVVKLKKIPISDARVDPIPDGDLNLLVVPALSFSGNTTPTAGVVTNADLTQSQSSSGDFTHVLEFYVAPENIPETMKVLGEVNAHLDKELAEQLKS
ncbi:hypothetical protein E2R51_04445 [Jeotgalibacillus sp. S-D1]|uniref:hypothetical protein n=1 Tax=Jeotgalibacillus sp. S-D1 TaxID=2552189 RepID=UPI00105A33B2|nr:hypothetical protein [Jeotgalibacillus sp. S-D1]TDL34977.1 hypothetical protein E2R51_04445 [Jeotgalibacillus sp. S-D1]